MISLLLSNAKELLSKTAMPIIAPATGTGVGIISFFEEITPILTVVSLLTGIVLGILSYRLQCKKVRSKTESDEI